jgi:hypothetical protein
MDDESNGVVAAEIAVLVPSLRASLRVICPLIVLPDSQDYIPIKPLSTQFKSVQIKFENTSHQKPLPFPCHQLTCLRQVKRGMPRGDIGSLRHTSALSLGNSPLPFNNPPLFVIPSEARNLLCASIPLRFPRATLPLILPHNSDSSGLHRTLARPCQSSVIDLTESQP